MFEIADLNPAQREAVETIDGPLLILAGPGSGKTRVVTQRIAHMLQQGIPGQSILALTFTNKAAGEMRNRVDALMPSSDVWIGTFHRFCARLIRRHAAFVGLSPNFTILDMNDSGTLMKHVLKTQRIELGMYTVGQVSKAISHAKSLGVTPETFQPRPGSPMGEIVGRVYPLYQKQLLTANGVDFDDLLLHTVTVLRENPLIRQDYDAHYRYVMVDEYQDTNSAQYGIVRMMNVNYTNVAVTGDPDQSIYGWRGATLDNILSFERDYPTAKVVRLEQNYRSSPEILTVADIVIQHNVRRKSKNLIAMCESGDLPRILKRATQREEADTIGTEIAAMLATGEYKGEDIAVFYRTNSLSRSLEQAFRHHAIPYQVVRGVSFFQRKEIKDLIGYLQLINNPQNDAALLRVINLPARGIGAKTIQGIAMVANSAGCSLLAACREPELNGLIGKKAQRSVASFVALADELFTHVDAPLEEILGTVISLTKYDLLLEDADNDAESTEVDRAANVRELLNDAKEFDEKQGEEPGALEAYLEQVSLVNDVDGWDSEKSCVTLMTLHASKGLEFPIVYLIGVEDGLMPHERSKEDGDIEEERRLFFVGLTRAKRKLTLSHVSYRARRGGLHPAIPSPFFVEIPRDTVQWDDETSQFGGPYGQPVRRGGVESDDAYFEPPIEDDEPAIQYRADGSEITIDPSRSASPEPHESFQEQDEFSQTMDEFDSSGDSATNSPAPVRKTRMRLVTAAAMLPDQRDDAVQPTNPDRFEHGMLVEHEQHGLGKIVSLSGSGTKRRATVQFFSGPQRSFVLSHTPIRPVRSAD
jgi:DNA helicase-2/ATP-dependent DNA helicase PcrA